MSYQMTNLRQVLLQVNLTELQEQLTEADTVKIKYREEKTYLRYC